MENYKNAIIQKKEFLIFKIATFFLLSAPFISSILFLISILITILNKKDGFSIRKWNIPFCVCALFILLSAILSTFFDRNYLIGWQNYINWLGLFNWIPFFLCFWSFQNYTKSVIQRKQIIMSFISGSVPLLITGFGQLWFNWHGPFYLFNKLIIWYQKPIGEGDVTGMSGLFSNPNYAASWLLIIWPMCLGLINQKISNKFKKTFLLTFLFSLFISILLTRSRNAWLGGIISIPLVFKSNILLSATIGLILVLIIFLLILYPILPSTINSFFSNLITNIINSESLSLNLNVINNFPRVIIWTEAISSIFKRPLFGWGAASFPFLMSSASNEKIYQHTHNLILELAISYGLPAAIIFVITILMILYKSFRSIYINGPSENYLDRAWWTSTFTIFLSQMFDIQYFDLRISLSFWILMAGLVSIIEENNKELEDNLK